MTKKYARTTEEIAEALGYKTHSAVTKRLQAVREQFEMYIKEQGQDIDKAEFAGVIDENCRSYRKQKTIS